MENIVLIDDVGDCVAKTLRGICEGVLKARAEGINAELPENGEIQFSMTIVKNFQNLDVKRKENGTQDETQGGKTTEVQGGLTTEVQTTVSKETGITKKKETSKQNEKTESARANNHDQKVERKLESSETP